MKKTRFLYAGIMAAAAAAFLIGESRQALFVLLGMALLYLIMFSLTIWSAAGVDVKISMQSECKVGQKIPIRVSVTEQPFLPMGEIHLEIEAFNILFQSTKTMELILEPGNSSSMEYQWMYESQLCGRTYFEIKKCTCYDLLLLTQKEKNIKKKWDATMYPQNIDLRANIEWNQKRQNLGDLHQQNQRGSDVSEIFDIREYREGDGLKSIHWKLSSKQDRFMVKEFSQPSNFDTLILINVARTSQGEQIPDSINNDVLGIAGAVCRDLLQQGIGHHVGQMKKDGFVEKSAFELMSYDQILTDMMSIEIQEDAKSCMETFLSLNLYQNFSKVILVTGKFEEAAAAELGEYVSLTVILPSAERSYMESNDAFHVVSIAQDGMEEKMHYIKV